MLPGWNALNSQPLEKTLIRKYLFAIRVVLEVSTRIMALPQYLNTEYLERLVADPMDRDRSESLPA